MAITTAAAILGGTALSVGAGIVGSRSAARSGERAADSSIAADERALETARGDLQPFRDVGEEALNPLLEMILQPDSDFERTEGFDAIENSAAADGKLRSGGTLKDLTAFNSGLNEKNRSRRTSELFNVAALGSNAAGGQATGTLNTGANIGNSFLARGAATADGIINATNATRRGISDLTSFLALR